MKHYWQFWTVRASAITSFLAGLLMTWNMLPIQLQRLLPDWIEIPVATVVFVSNLIIVPWLRARNAPRPS